MASSVYKGRRKFGSGDSDGAETHRTAQSSAEFERKFAALTAQLEQKVEQNITLQQQAELDLRLIMDLQEENKKLLSLLADQKMMSSEYQRRNESMAVGLNMMAAENLQLRAALDLKDGGKKGSSFASTAIVDSEQEMIMTQKISDLSNELKKLKKKFHKSQENEASLQENVEMYEEELKRKKKNWKDAIQKEARRRKNAENEARRLKAKVEELEFLLDQRETSDDLTSSEEENEKIVLGADDLDDLSYVGISEQQPSSKPSLRSATTEDDLRQVSSEISTILRLDGRSISNTNQQQDSVMELEGENFVAELLEQKESEPSSDSHDTLRVESDDFEMTLRKRVQERQRVMEARTKRIELEEGFERLRQRAESSRSTPSPRATTAPENEPAMAPSRVENIFSAPSDTVESIPKKVSFLDKIAAVFKPKEGEAEGKK